MIQVICFLLFRKRELAKFQALILLFNKLRGRGFKEVAREPRGNGVVLYGADTGFSPLLL